MPFNFITYQNTYHYQQVPVSYPEPSAPPAPIYGHEANYQFPVPSAPLPDDEAAPVEGQTKGRMARWYETGKKWGNDAGEVVGVIAGPIVFFALLLVILAKVNENSEKSRQKDSSSNCRNDWFNHCNSNRCYRRCHRCDHSPEISGSFLSALSNGGKMVVGAAGGVAGGITGVFCAGAYNGGEALYNGGKVLLNGVSQVSFMIYE